MTQGGWFSGGRPGFRLAVVIPMLALVGLATAFGAPPGKGHLPPDIPVTTTISELDYNGNPSTIVSDGLGAYLDGVDGVVSVLATAAYNYLYNGDWQFNKDSASTRKVGVVLNVSDEVLSGDPHYQAPAIPPFLGTQILPGHAQVKCTFVYQSMLTMTAGTSVICPMLLGFTTPDNVQYNLNPAFSWNHYPEVTDAQVTCNSVDGDGCNDWDITPISFGQAVGRLEYPARHNDPTHGNVGDMYMRFWFHVTRP
jgi:hypothetical protein